MENPATIKPNDEADISFGNAEDLSNERRGWFFGYFMGSPGDPFHSEALELKWGQHPAGDARSEWAAGPGTTLALLVRGEFRVIFSDQEVLLKKPGDFVVWRPGVFHRWEAVEETLIISIRWPSKASE